LVNFEVPVWTADLSLDTMLTAVLTFDYDPQRLTFRGAATTGQDISLGDVSETVLGSRKRVALSLAARGSETLNGADTIVRLYFLGYIGLDTVCETLGALTFQARQGLVGNTNYTPNAICLEGSNFSSVQAGGPDGIEFGIF